MVDSSSKLVLALVAAMHMAGCSLSNISVDDCVDNVECENAFGLGSACVDGFCSEPPTCESGHGCRSAFGGGACVEGVCRDKAPPDPEGVCTVLEPENLFDRSLTHDATPFTIVGSMFRLNDSSDARVSLGAQLAVREIQEVSGLNEGGGIGMVFCDNGGDLVGEERIDRIHSVIDYLAGTLGAPFIVGPGTSTDALDAINYIVSQDYPTALISPSATSPTLSKEPDNNLFWRTAPSDVLQGQLLATDVVGVYPTPPPPVQRVAVVHLNDAYGQGLADVFQTEWVKTAGNEVQTFPFADNDDNDWATIAASVNVNGSPPDAVMMIAITASRTVNFIREMATLTDLQLLPLYLTDGSKDANILLDDSLEANVKTIIFEQVIGTAPAGPASNSTAFNLFRGNYNMSFSEDPTGFAFVANAYDAAYVGAAGLVWAAQDGSSYDGTDVAEGMARLVGGMELIEVSKTKWSAIKSGLTTSEKMIDIVGISGNLDFDSVGEATAPIEVWQPTRVATECSTGSVCFKEIGRIDPD